MDSAAAQIDFSEGHDVVLRSGAPAPFVLRDRAIRLPAPAARLHFSTAGIPASPGRKTIFLADLRDDRLSLKFPIPLYVDRAGAQVFAFSYDLEELTVANEEWTAVADMREAIVAVYFLLREDRDNLGSVMQAHWNFLQRVVAETP